MKISDANTQRNIWDKILNSIKDSNKVSNQLFNAYFKKTFISSVEGSKIIVGCESAAGTNILKNNFKELFLSNVAKTTGTDFDIVFVPLVELKVKTKEQIIKESDPVYFKSSKLDPSFTFEKFIEGPSNKEARKASLMVASNPGNMYNPLYIQGDSGLGKTHLLHAIAHQIKESYPEKKILYTTSQSFFDEYITFTKNVTNNLNLTDYLKNIDVLLIDDIQGLVDHKKTESYFFDLFNYFVDNEKQIVLTCDKLPSELKGIEQRLVTRFSQGLLSKINPPSLETSIEILKSKLIQNGIPNRLITRFLSGLSVVISKPNFATCKEILLKKIEFSAMNTSDFSDDALDYISENYSSSIRQLEGILTRLTFYTTINNYNGTIDLNYLTEALGLTNIKIDKNIQVDSKRILHVVSDYYSISIEQIKGSSRKNQVVIARQIAMYLIRTILDTPLIEIGKIFSNRDHTTVMHSIAKVDNMLKTDSQLENVISTLRTKING